MSINIAELYLDSELIGKFDYVEVEFKNESRSLLKKGSKIATIFEGDSYINFHLKEGDLYKEFTDLSSDYTLVVYKVEEVEQKQYSFTLEHCNLLYVNEHTNVIKGKAKLFTNGIDVVNAE